jgi:hypothetical protein
MSKDRNYLLQLFSPALTKNRVRELSLLIDDSGIDLNEIIGVTLNPDRAIAFRAAWVLENIVLTNPMRLMSHIESFLAAYVDIQNTSCQRHYAKIFMYITGSKVHPDIKNWLLTLDLEPVAEHCFDLLINKKIPVAVKVFICETLYNLSPRYQWIASLLKEQLELLKDGAKPGVRVMCTRLLGKLKTTN